jgi:chromosome segregation ATPase
LGAQATAEEQEQIKQATLALLETEQVLQKLTLANKDFVAGEELRISALERLQGTTEQTDVALLSSIRTSMLLQTTTKKTEREFEKLSTTLTESVVALDKLEKELKQGVGSGEGAKKKFAALSKEADRLRKVIDKSRAGLQKLDQKLRDSGETAIAAGGSIRNLGSDFSLASAGVDEFNSALDRNRRGLEDVASAAESTSDSLVSVGRATRSLGPVVGGSGGPEDIQRALNALNAQLRQVGYSSDVFGFRSIQSKAIRAQIDALEADLVAANEQVRREIIEGVIRANEELSGDALEEAIAEGISIRQRHGILPTAGSNKAGFQSLQAARI